MAEETDAERIARLEAALEEAEDKITEIADKTDTLATAPSKPSWDAFASTYIDKMSFNRQLGVILAVTCIVIIIFYRYNELNHKGANWHLWPFVTLALPVVFIAGCFARISIERQVLEELDWVGETESPEQGVWITRTPVLIAISALAQIFFMSEFLTDQASNITDAFDDRYYDASRTIKTKAFVFFFIIYSLSLGSIVMAMVSLPFIQRQTGAEHYALIEITALATGFAAVLASLGILFYQIAHGGSGYLPWGSWFLTAFTLALSITAAAFSIGLLTFTKKEKEKAIERIKVEGGTEIDPSLADKEVKENVFSNISFDSDDVGLILAILLPSLLITALTFMFIGMKEAVIMGPLLIIILMVTAQLVKRKANAPPKVRGIGKQIIRRDSPPKKPKRDSNIPAGWTKEQYEQYGHISAAGPDEDL